MLLLLGSNGKHSFLASSASFGNIFSQWLDFQRKTVSYDEAGALIGLVFKRCSCKVLGVSRSLLLLLGPLFHLPLPTLLRRRFGLAGRY